MLGYDVRVIIYDERKYVRGRRTNYWFVYAQVYTHVLSLTYEPSHTPRTYVIDETSPMFSSVCSGVKVDLDWGVELWPAQRAVVGATAKWPVATVRVVRHIWAIHPKVAVALS